ncbi:MAG: thiamine pyrophosphate-dependent enzyme [Anaerolineaceae bacterium]|nr:thiamine pyrophosphate-dependent enzyme [Anaerolineaceae bacterium]
MKKLITGNEAVAYGALSAGVKVVTGYPGTPSTGCIASLLTMDLKETYVEWSVNEKVALEVAAGVAWSGHRALCTMKMSGVNVAYDTLISVAYSGCDGGLVIYVADDPGANAGMCEQDSRSFAVMADMPMLEPDSVAESYHLTKYAFELSEKIKGPVFIRSVTAIADAFAEVEVEQPAPVSTQPAQLVRDIQKYTKAGSLIATNQHRDLIGRLEKAEQIIEQEGINPIHFAEKKGGLGIIAAGVAAAYLEEGFEVLSSYGFNPQEVSTLILKAASPFPGQSVLKMLDHCQKLLVLEELEPLVERGVYVEAQKAGFQGKIIGKLDGVFSRIGEYGVREVVRGVNAALQLGIGEDLFIGNTQALQIAASRPITVCAGCPHRGTYMAVEKAIRKLKLKKNQVMVTGDIGCTILGMNPPFDLIWNEVSMGASVSLAQGFVRAGVSTPVVATIGDSTFFHAGLPGLINAIQHKVDLTLIIMDNRWTAMTGMQINPGTPCRAGTNNYQEIDIARIIPALGIEHFWTIDPFKLEESSEVIRQAMKLPGVKVVLARQECAIQAQRLGKQAGMVKVVEENCNLCKLCLMATGCSALSIGANAIEIDSELCYGCGICIETCNREALIEEAV